MKKFKKIAKLSLVFFLLFQFQLLPFFSLSSFKIPGTNIEINPAKFSLINPPVVDTAGISSASATLSNSRLSFQGKINANYDRGATLITIDTTTTNADINTNHLFPNDDISVGPNGTMKVSTVSSTTVFSLQQGLTEGVQTGDVNPYIYATQSGTLTIDFYTAAAIPVGGSVLVEIPASTGSISGSANDKAPDTNSTVLTNGFDLNGITTSNVTCPGSFTAGTITTGTSGAAHKITCNWGPSTALPAGAHLTVVVGDGTAGLINPAPLNSGVHTQGTSDVYTIRAFSKSSADGAGTTLENVDMRVAPIEGVLVSAYVDETLSFTLTGNAAGATRCGLSTSVTTTATSVPWGSISVANSFLNAAQTITLSTNAPSGYAVKIEENDQMGKDGVVCTGADAGESVSCIKDATCDGGACTQAVDKDWVTATNNGLGYSLQNVSGSHVAFAYNVPDANCTGSPTYCAKQIADQEVPETKATIMSHTLPVSGDSAYVCFKISVSGTQPAGYYYNKVKYTATPIF